MQLRKALSIAALAAMPSFASAEFLNPTWDRNTPYTTYQRWDIFGTTAGPNAPDIAQFPDNTTSPHPPLPNVSDSSGVSFLTSGGNIYSPTGRVLIDATVPDYNLGDGYVTTVFLQTRTQGTEPLYNDIRVRYTDGSGEHSVAPLDSGIELERIPLGGFGGFRVEHAIAFQVPASAGLLTFDIDAPESSMSFDRLAIDTLTTRASDASPLLAGMNSTIGFAVSPIPEPAAAAPLLLAFLAFRRVRRNSRR